MSMTVLVSTLKPDAEVTAKCAPEGNMGWELCIVKQSYEIMTLWSYIAQPQDL